MKKLILSFLAIAAFTEMQIEARTVFVTNDVGGLYIANANNTFTPLHAGLVSLPYPGVYRFYSDKNITLNAQGFAPKDRAAFLQLEYTNMGQIASPSISVVGSNYSLQLDVPSRSFTGDANIIPSSSNPSGLDIK